jgi:hypothetical protein
MYFGFFYLNKVILVTFPTSVDYERRLEDSLVDYQ